MTRPPLRLLLIITLIILNSCNKEQAKESLLQTRTNILTTGTWKMTRYTRQDIVSSYVDVYAGYPDCRKDDHRTFITNGNCDIDEGPSKCNPSDPQVHTIPWRFLNNTASGIELDWTEYTISNLDQNQLRLVRSNAGAQTIIEFSR